MSLSDLHAAGVTDLDSYQAGVSDEQERIIKLLEDRRVTCVGDIDCFELVETGSCDCTDLIALIKGETE